MITQAEYILKCDEEHKKWLQESIQVASEYANLKNKPMGIICDCGAEIHEERGVYWCMRPMHQGIICPACTRRGYFHSWVGTYKFVWMEKDGKPINPENT